MTAPSTTPARSHHRRNLRRWAGRIAAAAAGLFVFCVLPVLLLGGGTATVTAGLIAEGEQTLVIGVVLGALALGYLAVHRRRARRRVKPVDQTTSRPQARRPAP